MENEMKRQLDYAEQEIIDLKRENEALESALVSCQTEIRRLRSVIREMYEEAHEEKE